MASKKLVFTRTASGRLKYMGSTTKTAKSLGVTKTKKKRTKKRGK